MMKEPPITPQRFFLRTIAIFVGLFLLYALAVEVTEIDVTRLRDERRQVQVVGVLRLLADPNMTDPDILDRIFGADRGPFTLTETMRNTLRLIVETIFMALMATTIGTLLAIPVSFLAARNLMVEVTMPLAAIMAALIATPIGGGLGWLITRQLLNLADGLVAQTLVGFIGLLLVAAVIVFLLRQGTQTQIGGVLGRSLLILLLTLFGLGLLAGISIPTGNWLAIQLRAVGLGFLGEALTVIADAVNLLLAPFVGLIGALVAASLGSRYGQEAVLRLPTGAAKIVTAVLTLFGTAILIYAIGSALNWLYQYDNPANWTTFPALVGGVVAAILSLLVAVKRPFRSGAAIYTFSRSILNILRSIEPLIMAVIFVVWVGLGPFAGVLALTLHTIAALGKLFSEQIEGISAGPIEAITATGANRLQTIVFAVIPQIIPPYIAYTLYRWDINVRTSTIIGFVGGGGIGFLLDQSIRLLRYRDASVMMLAIAVVVSTLDYVSSRVRNRVI
jgi:phosphonate ABC transporter permease subunit PhnE